jgi:hypothetical protein
MGKRERESTMEHWIDLEFVLAVLQVSLQFSDAIGQLLLG